MPGARHRRFGFKGADRLSARLESLKKESENLFRSGALQTFGDVVQDTPIDTGFARASWRIITERRSDPVVIVFVNGANYAIYLEYGWSQQAPHGMLRINLERFARDFALVWKELMRRA